MIQVQFKNLKRSEIAEAVAFERIEPLLDKFPDLLASRVKITLEMENSPIQSGPDLFSAKVHVAGGRYDGVTVRKSNLSLYAALADVADHMLEALNRSGDRARVKQRNKARRISNGEGLLEFRSDRVFDSPMGTDQE